MSKGFWVSPMKGMNIEADSVTRTDLGDKRRVLFDL